ncbi:MAG: uroporphyrinogen decarboxylase family protein [Armatimonadota bacterium]
MAYPNVLEDVQTCIDLGVPSRVPIFMLGEEFDVEQYGIDYREYVESPEHMIECWVQAVEMFDYDWILLHPDDYIEFEPLGVKTQADAKTPPAPVEQIEADIDVLKSLEIPDAASAGRMPAHLEALQGIRERMGDSVVLAGRVAAPFSSVALLYGVQEALMLMLTDPALFNAALDFCTDLMIYWGQQQLDAGADALWVGDCVACSGFISAGDYEMYAYPGATKLCSAIQQAGGWAYYHAGEHSMEHLRLEAATGCDILNVGEGIDLAEVKAELGDTVCLSGNLNPIEIFEMKELDDVRAATRRVMEAGKPGGAYIFNSGEGVPRPTDAETIAACMETARSMAPYEEADAQ